MGWVLLTLLMWRTAAAQEAQAVDRTDAEAVAKAYLQACRGGNAEAALALIEPDQRLQEALREFVSSFREEGGPGDLGLTFGDVLKEFLFVPLQVGVEDSHAATTREGDTAHVSFRASFAYDQQVVLARQPDGTWVVKLLESIRATTGQDRTFLEMEMGLEEEPVGPDDMVAQMVGVAEGGPYTEALSRLWTAVAEYAREHENRLPPAETWVDEIELYVLDRDAFRSPDAPHLEYAYAMNGEVGGRDWQQLFGGEGAEDPLLFIEWHTGERNAVVTPDHIPEAKSFRGDKSLRYICIGGFQAELVEGKTWADALADRANEVDEPAQEEDRAREQYFACQQRLMVLARAIRIYARQHGGLLPAAETWQDDIAPLLLQVAGEGEPWGDGPAVDPADCLRCPAAPDLDFGYAINRELAGKNALDLHGHASLVLIFESDANLPNAHGDPTQDAAPARHRLHGDRMASLCAHLTGDVGEVASTTDG